MPGISRHPRIEAARTDRSRPVLCPLLQIHLKTFNERTGRDLSVREASNNVSRDILGQIYGSFQIHLRKKSYYSENIPSGPADFFGIIPLREKGSFPKKIHEIC